MFYKPYLFVITSLVFFTAVVAQDNAQRKIAPRLIECYSDPYLSNRDNLLPHTMESLIKIIRKIESAPALNEGIMQLSVSLLHGFRQDGIVRNADASTSNVVLPYSASEFQLGKHQILLRKLIPGDARAFPNDTLTAVERCSLHSMLSTSVDVRKRGDEAQRCNQLANYRAMRIPRSLKAPVDNSKRNALEDVEFIDKTRGKGKAETFGKMKATQSSKDDKEDDYGDDYGDSPKEHVDTIDFLGNNNERSECPVENGVVKTLWGTIAPGNVINGIATGLQNQRVALNTLIGPRRRSSQQANVYVDGRWASTLAGDLAEVVLRQVARDPRPGNINIGGSGAWNSSIAPKWYFLSIRDKFEMTDAEIRGDMDGLIIAHKIREWEQQVGDLKLSHVLDMYYSQNGVMGTNIRACDRKKLFNELVKSEELIRQTAAFSRLLQESIASVTIKDEGFTIFSEIAAKELMSYISQSLNDVSCESTVPNPNIIESEVATDLFVFVDTTWPFETIKGYIEFILSKMNFNKRASSVTLYDGMDAKNISNVTTDYSSVLMSWTKEVHSQRRQGLNLPNILMTLHNNTMELLNNEKKSIFAGGRSLVGLIVPYSAAISESDSDYAWDWVQRLREEVPDIRLLFFAEGSVNRFERFVIDKQKDLISAQNSNDAQAVVVPVVNRLKELSRRVINPRCGSEWNNADTGSSAFTQCVSPGSPRFYRLMPNYFFSEKGDRKLKLKTDASTTTLSVCVSRIMENPLTNTSGIKPDDLKCENIISKTFELDLSKPCGDAYEINKCSPYYLSVEIVKDSVGAAPPPILNRECNSPNDIPFTITTEHLTCHSGVERIYSKFSILIILGVLGRFFIN